MLFHTYHVLKLERKDRILRLISGGEQGVLQKEIVEVAEGSLHAYRDALLHILFLTCLAVALS